MPRESVYWNKCAFQGKRLGRGIRDKLRDFANSNCLALGVFVRSSYQPHHPAELTWSLNVNRPS